MYIDGVWIVVGAIIVGCSIYAAMRENVRDKKMEPQPQVDHEAALKHEATREQWRNILAEQNPLSDKNQQAYMAFICMETALKKAAEAGKGNRWSFKDLAEAGELQKQCIARAQELLGQMNEACERCDAEERLTGSKDGPSRPIVLKMAAEIDAALLEAGWINELKKFREMFDYWRDSPATGSSRISFND